MSATLATLRDLMPGEKEWPRANMLRKSLSRMSVGLRALGIEWEVLEASRHDNVASLRVWATERFKPIDHKVDDREAGLGHF